jgi:alcohol dehydrogenase
VSHLGEEAARIGRRALLVTGRGALKKAGITQRLVQLLEAAGVEVELFDEVRPEPDVLVVDRARERIRLGACDLVVEAGGGSALDVGKAAAALALADAPTAEYHRGMAMPERGLPHIAIPTTAGTGSEATPNSVLTDAALMLKRSIRGAALVPHVCVVDGALTVSCSPTVTAASGMDALTQAIESYLSIHAIPFTEALSREAVKMIVPNLTAAFARGDDLPARAAMLEASFMAGVALANARLGAVHGLAHPLGVIYGLPHGVVCAVLLPHVLRRNAEAASEKYGVLEHTMGGDPVEKTEELLSALSLPRTMGQYPDAREEGAIIEEALKSGSSLANPVPVDEGFVIEILEAVCT